MNLFSCLLSLLFILCSLYSVSPVKDPKHSSDHSGSKKAHNCYFAIAKKSTLETYRRPRSAVTKSSCSDKLIDLTSLALNVDGHFFGAPHEMALIISRFQGLYLDENADLTNWKGEKICSAHLNELSRQYYREQYKHQKRGGKYILCGFPEKDHDLDKDGKEKIKDVKGQEQKVQASNKAVKGLELTYSQSKYLLENRHFLLLPGTPLCRRHHDELIGMAAHHGHESTLNLKKESDTDTEGDGEVEDMVIDEEEDSEGECAAEEEEDEDPDFTARMTPNPLRSFLSQFAKEAGVRGARACKPWKKLTHRAKNYRSHSLVDLVKAMLPLFADTADGQSQLKKMVVDVLEGRSPSLDQELIADAIMTQVADHYKKALNAHDRIWTLAPFTKLFDYPTMSRYIENLSHRMWTQAVRMAIDQNSFIPPKDRIVERYDLVKLIYFINFLTSPHILIQLPYGDATVQDSHGNTMHVANCIRQTGIYETIRIYEAYMKEVGLESLLLHRTTMYNILSYLPIKKAHSLTCVDYYQADATNAFISIARMIDELVANNFLDKSDAAHLKREFEERKLYLRGNFRLHVKMESLYSDHCLIWSLSHPTQKHFQSDHTSHTHQQRCPDCIAIDSVFNDMKELLKQYAAKTGLTLEVQKKIDGFIHDFDLHYETILDLKAHYARSVYATMEHQRIVASLKEDQALLIFDYSQKWEGKQYREPQSEYYGKSGVSWHVIYIYANIEGKGVTHAAIHIMKDAEQDATAVVAIALHWLKQLKIMQIKEAHVRSDNAPYYHCAALIASMPDISRKSEVKVLSYSFSEKQAGKSGADQRGGLGKRKMLSQRDKQHKVITPEEMFEALVAPRQLRAFSIFLATVVEKKKSTTKIPKITELSHFEFHGKNSARAWRFHGIGDGIEIHHLDPTEAELVIKDGHSGGKLATAAINLQDRKRIIESKTKPIGQYEEPTFWLLPKERAPVEDTEPNDKDDDIVTPNTPDPYSPAGAAKPSLFYCPDPACGASFIRHSNLEKHANTQAHKIRPHSIKMLDRVLGLFSRAIETVLAPIGFSPVSEVAKAFKGTPEPELPQGWAIRNTRKTGRYPETTKAFIKEKFNEYARRGLKLRANEAEQLMRNDDQILPKEWMTLNQLRNLINTLKAAKPKIRAWRRALEEEEEVHHDHHEEVEVGEIQDEDIRLTDDDWFHHFTASLLKLIFKDSTNPIFPNTQVPQGATEYD